MNAENRPFHLTDDEFSLLLDGAQPGPLAAAHLACCEFCRTELEAVQASLSDFREIGTAWAEAAAPQHIPLPARWLEKMHWQRSWGAGLVATAATGVLAFWLGYAPQAHQAALPHTQVMAPTNADLAADNSLLQSIDTELTEQTQPMASAADLPLGPRHIAHHTVGTVTD